MGRPKGAKNRDKPWRDALRKASRDLEIDEAGDGKKHRALGLVAKSLVKKAIAGDIAAAKEVGDRLDGKAVQGVELDVAVTVTAIERTIVDPQLVGPVIDAVAVEDDEE